MSWPERWKSPSSIPAKPKSTAVQAASQPIGTRESAPGAACVHERITATGSAKNAVGFASSARAKQAVASAGRAGSQSSAASASTSDDELLSCEIHATASTFAGWSRKSAPPSHATSSLAPHRRSSRASSTDASACSPRLSR